MYSKICDLQNIYSAYLKARSCKRYKHEILKYTKDLENQLILINKELHDKTYKHGKYYEFIVNDSKKRVIQVAPFKDRIIHHSLCNIIEPIFDKKFIYDSYACRKEKGSHKAINRLRKFIRSIKDRNNFENYEGIYYLKCDIVKYFNSINRDILFRLIIKSIKDQSTLWLIEKIINSYTSGLPIGNLTSQLFANIYLHELDFFVKNKLRCKYYIRYMDDFIILDVDKQKLKNNYLLIKEFVYNELKLKIDDQKTILSLANLGITFLGFQIFPYILLLKINTIKRFVKKTKKQMSHFQTKKEKLICLSNKFVNWRSYYKHGDAYGFAKRLFCKIGIKYDKNIWEWGNMV